jgi:uncharacterized cupredoxin-like copper-binding protein
MKKWLIAVMLIANIYLAACAVGGPTTEINVTLTDFQFTPNTFTVPAGAEITLHVVNTGAVVHNFVIMNPGETAGATFDDEDEAIVYWQQVDIQPGGDTTETFIAPSEPGEYEIVCRTEGHIASGMVGKLIVVAGE